MPASPRTAAKEIRNHALAQVEINEHRQQLAVDVAQHLLAHEQISDLLDGRTDLAEAAAIQLVNQIEMMIFMREQESRAEAERDTRTEEEVEADDRRLAALAENPPEDHGPLPDGSDLHRAAG